MRNTQPKSPVRERREARGMTQSELAVLASLSPTTISIAERFGLVTEATAARIAKVLGCDAAELRP